jgi:hypothetical protein
LVRCGWFAPFGWVATGELYPVASAGPAWTDGDNTAICRRRHADEVPSPRCGCGFYGYGALSVLRAEYPGRRRHRGGGACGADSFRPGWGHALAGDGPGAHRHHELRALHALRLGLPRRTARSDLRPYRRRSDCAREDEEPVPSRRLAAEVPQ